MPSNDDAPIAAEGTAGFLEALTTTNMLLMQIAQDMSVIVEVIKSVTVEPVSGIDDGTVAELPQKTPYRDRLLAAGIYSLEDVPLVLSSMKEMIGLNDNEAAALAHFRDRALRRAGMQGE